MEYSEGVWNFKLPFLSAKTNFQSLTMYKIGLAICTVRAKTVLFAQRYIVPSSFLSIVRFRDRFLKQWDGDVGQPPHAFLLPWASAPT